MYVHDTSPQHPSSVVVAELTHAEKQALEVLISAGATHVAYNSYGPGLRGDDPVVSACRKLGLTPTGIERYFCPGAVAEAP